MTQLSLSDPLEQGKPSVLIDGWITYSIICDPSDFLLVQLTQEKASEHSRKRLDRTFRCSPEIAKRLSPRKNDNNVHDKYFRAGNLLKIGWPSINVLSSSDYKYVALTDYDRWPDDIDGEGDGFSLASKRTTTFMSAGMTLVEIPRGHRPQRDLSTSHPLFGKSARKHHVPTSRYQNGIDLRTSSRNVMGEYEKNQGEIS